MASGSYAQVVAERDYLLGRAEAAGTCGLDNSQRWTGVSSNALIRHVFGGAEPTEREFPRDPSDLAACYRAVYRLPEHLKGPDGVANEWIVTFRHSVEKRYELHEMDRMLEREPSHKGK